MNWDFGNALAISTVVRDLCSGLELLHDAAGQSREPRGYQLVVIAGPEKAGHRAEHAAGLIAPGDTAPGLEGGLNLGLVVEQCRHQVEPAHQVDRALGNREHHGLLGRHGELRRGGIVGQVVGAGLIGQPLAQVPWVDLRAAGELGGRHRSFGVQFLVQSKRIAHSDHGDAGCAAEVVEHLTDKCVELAFINLCRSIYARHTFLQ
jgi:hypothetical protein